jgi:hypothetical protein
MEISGQPQRLVLTDTAGPEEQLGVESGVELLTCRGHCYSGQSAGCGIHDVADADCDGFKISAAHAWLLLCTIP